MATMIDPLIRKLERLGPLSDGERRLLDAVPLEVRRVEARQVLIRGDDPLSDCHLLLEGMACGCKMAEGGRRRITSFHMAGDILDLGGLPEACSNCGEPKAPADTITSARACTQTRCLPRRISTPVARFPSNTIRIAWESANTVRLARLVAR